MTQVSSASKERIAGGNLVRLLKGQEPIGIQALRGADEIVSEARLGRPLSVNVIDAHAHVLHEGGEGAGPRYLMHRGDADGILEVNCWCGIDRIAMMSWNGPVCTDAADGNDIVHRALMHVGSHTGGVAGVGKLAGRYPEVSWLIAHSGMSWSMAVSVAECIKEHPNVYAEITYTAVTNGSIEYLCGEIGADHVIFGSDAPMRDPRPQLGWVVWADLPASDRRSILAGNFQRILDRARLPPSGIHKGNV